MPRDTLGPFEFEVLSVLQQQPRDAYGVTIHERLEERSGRSVNVGSLYVTLERLERKGFVSSQWGEATPERGGRRKRYYKIEASGAKALNRFEESLRRFGSGTLVPHGA